METIIEKKYQEEAEEFLEFLEELDKEERKSIMEWINGARYMNNLRKQSTQS
ncbi:MAG: hypothetical protein U0N77_02925 [Turicibacter sanguinis]|uniref:hypothetical protein n=1 Tax=Turicibacter sanguinis TaxID=154288 RepID=UPI002F936696